MNSLWLLLALSAALLCGVAAVIVRGRSREHKVTVRFRPKDRKITIRFRPEKVWLEVGGGFTTVSCRSKDPDSRRLYRALERTLMGEGRPSALDLPDRGPLTPLRLTAHRAAQRLSPWRRS